MRRWSLLLRPEHPGDAVHETLDRIPGAGPRVRQCRTPRGVDVSWSSQGTRGPAVLVVSGWLTNAALEWTSGPSARFHRQLATQQRVIGFDLPGCGLSPTPPEGLSLQTAIDAAEAVVLASGEHTVAVLSYGFADAVATGLAARRPDLSHTWC